MKISHEMMENMLALEILDKENISNFYKLGDDFAIHLMIDLYVNALRKAEVGMYEDAISRLYRSIELISQYRLNSYNIETTGADLLRFDKDYKIITNKIYGFEKPLPFEIGLKDGFILLFILKDYIMDEESVESLSNIFGTIRSRDMSIIAHGLNLAGEKVFNNINQITKRLILNICKKNNKDFSQIIKQHTFAKL